MKHFSKVTGPARMTCALTLYLQYKPFLTKKHDYCSKHVQTEQEKTSTHIPDLNIFNFKRGRKASSVRRIGGLRYPTMHSPVDLFMVTS